MACSKASRRSGELANCSLLLLDACRRGGADRITAVVPYFGYARQDRRGQAGEAVGGRVVADALVTAGAQRLIVVDPHTAALEAMCGVPVEMLTAVPTLADAVLDRVIHNAYRIELAGESLRKRRSPS